MRTLRRSPSPVRQHRAPSLVNLFGAAGPSPIALLRENSARTYDTCSDIPFCSAPRRAASLAVLFYYARHARRCIALCHRAGRSRSRSPSALRRLVAWRRWRCLRKRRALSLCRRWWRNRARRKRVSSRIVPVVDVLVVPSISVVIVIVVVVAIRCRCRVSPALPSGENCLRPLVEGSLVRAARKSRKRWEFASACRVAVVVALSLITERGAITGRVRTPSECERAEGPSEDRVLHRSAIK